MQHSAAWNLKREQRIECQLDWVERLLGLNPWKAASISALMWTVLPPFMAFINALGTASIRETPDAFLGLLLVYFALFGVSAWRISERSRKAAWYFIFSLPINILMSSNLMNRGDFVTEPNFLPWIINGTFTMILLGTVLWYDLHRGIE